MPIYAKRLSSRQASASIHVNFGVPERDPSGTILTAGSFQKTSPVVTQRSMAVET